MLCLEYFIRSDVSRNVSVRSVKEVLRMSDDLHLIDSIAERELDLAIMSALYCSDEFRRFFIKTSTGFSGAHSFVRARISEWESGRETDVLLVVDLDDGQRLALMIEDKISADFQPAQADGYRERGLTGITDGRWTKFVTCLCAPHSYLTATCAADNWDTCISLEAVIELSSLSNDRSIEFVAMMCRQAISKRGARLLPVSKSDTLFWQQYRRLAAKLLPETSLTRLANEVSNAQQWPRFGANVLPSHMFVEHKSRQGHVDLTFDKVRSDNLKRHIPIPLPAEISAVKTGNSSALRIHVSPIDRLKTFEEQKEEMALALSAVQRLLEIGIALSTIKPFQQLVCFDTSKVGKATSL